MNIMLTKNISDNEATGALLSNLTDSGEIKQEDLVTLLDALKRQGQSQAYSTHKVILDHSVQICQAYLNNLLESEWHKHLHEQGKLKNKGLNEQLMLILKLLDSSILSAPNPGEGDTAPLSELPNELQILRRAWQSLDHWLKAPESTPINNTEPDNSVAERASFRNCVEALPNSYLIAEKGLLQSNGNESTAQLDVYFLGTFRLYSDGGLIDCLSKSRAKQLLKYLLLNRTKSIPKEVLMDRFWPDHDPSSARNNLNVAVYCLRQALKSEHSDFVHVLFQDGCYFLNPNLGVRVDTELFEFHIKTAEHLDALGKSAEAIEEYTRAEALYQGDFLAEDLYEDWSQEPREYYKSIYVKLLVKLSDFYYRENDLDPCIAVNRKITSVEMGDEHAHRRLMECFAKLNQRHLALRQYQLCADALGKEFDLKPSQQTVALYKSIKAEVGSEEQLPTLRLKQA